MIITIMITLINNNNNSNNNNPGGRAVQGVGLRPLDSWDRWFETRSGHGCLSLVFVVSCKYRPLRRGDHSSRLIVPSVCVCVCARARARSQTYPAPESAGEWLGDRPSSLRFFVVFLRSFSCALR